MIYSLRKQCIDVIFMLMLILSAGGLLFVFNRNIASTLFLGFLLIVLNFMEDKWKKTKVNSIINYLIKKYSKKIKIKSIPRINNNFIIGENKLAKNLLNWNISKNIYVAVDEMYKEFINIK